MTAATAKTTTVSSSTVVKSPFQYGAIDTPLLHRAVQALVKHHKKQSQLADKQSLLGDDTDVNVQIGLVEVPTRPSPKPIRLATPHPLHKIGGDDETGNDDDDYLERASVCLIVKDESKPWVQDMVAQFPAQLSCVKKVLTLDSLRKKHGRHAQRRELMGTYDVFLADDRILPMLGKSLGKKFFDKKKNPVPIHLTRKEALPFAVERCLTGTFLYLSAGRCVSIRAGNTAMPIHKLVENCEAVVKEAALKLPKKWKNVASLSIKTAQSVSLPFYSMTPEELQLVKEEIATTTIVTKKETVAVGKRARDDSATKVVGKQALKKKKRDASPSPLLQALKRTREEENADTTITTKVTPKESKKLKKKRRNKEEDAVTTTSTPEEPVKKKNRKVEEEVAVVTTPSKKEVVVTTPAKEEDATMSQSAKKRKKQRKKKNATPDKKAVEDASTPKKSADTKVIAKSESAKKEKSKEDKKDAPVFQASKKFKGSKKGYVFRMAGQGLGYYKDVVPVRDPSLYTNKGKQNNSNKKSNQKQRGRSRSTSRGRR